MKFSEFVEIAAKAHLAYRLKKSIEENAITQDALGRAIARFADPGIIVPLVETDRREK